MRFKERHQPTLEALAAIEKRVRPHMQRTHVVPANAMLRQQPLAPRTGEEELCTRRILSHLLKKQKN